MREIYEFRVNEKYAYRLFDRDEGIHLSDAVRKIRISRDDHRFRDIGRLQSAVMNSERDSFYFGWNIIRTYSTGELERAKLFYVNSARTFEPAGEECGTKYDDTVACSICGAGRMQVSDLVLDLRKIPKSSDIARTIANEWVVSQRFAELLVEEQISGVEIHPVHHKARYENDPFDLSLVPSGQELLRVAEADGFPYPTWQFWVWLNRPEQAQLVERATTEYANMRKHDAQRKGKAPPIWYQLKVISNPVTILSPPTQFGIDPFNEDLEGAYRCPLGHVLGLNILSELWIKHETWDRSDVVMTREMIGVRGGLLVPEPLVLISARLHKLMKERHITGYQVEIVHAV